MFCFAAKEFEKGLPPVFSSPIVSFKSIFSTLCLAFLFGRIPSLQKDFGSVALVPWNQMACFPLSGALNCLQTMLYMCSDGSSFPGGWAIEFRKLISFSSFTLSISVTDLVAVLKVEQSIVLFILNYLFISNLHKGCKVLIVFLKYLYYTIKSVFYCINPPRNIF